MSVLIRDCRVVTPNGPGPQRGKAMGELEVMPRADVWIEGGVIARVRSHEPGAASAGVARVIEARGRVLMPGFVDCHTHACFAGDRLEEWERRLRGATYQEILASGGGIMATVRAVRGASEGTLREFVAERLASMLAGGTTAVEIKSGYGLTAADELKMLRASAAAAAEWAGTVRLTALLGHAMDPAVSPSEYVRRTIHETLPAIHAEFPGIAVDAFLEAGAWSLADTRKLLSAARGLGHPVRLHADQFTSMGGVALAAELGAVSVDHLEASSSDTLASLAGSGVIGVALPICGLHLDNRYANLRPLIDAGGAGAVATNFNPGSAPSHSMPLAGALAVRRCGLTPAEAITATTANAAAVLGFMDRGFIAAGARADLVLLTHADERRLWHDLGADAVAMVMSAGEILRESCA